MRRRLKKNDFTYQIGGINQCAISSRNKNISKKNKQKLHIYTVDTARTIEVELEWENERWIRLLSKIELEVLFNPLNLWICSFGLGSSTAAILIAAPNDVVIRSQKVS